MRSTPSLRSLVYFLAATDTGSLTRAGAQVHVAPSAIAAAIDTVEAAFDLRLVQRYPAKGLALTAAGVALVPRIRHLIEEYDHLLASGTELREALSGELSIGYYAPVAPAFLPRVLKPLLAENPGVRVRFTECDNERAQAGLLSGAFDTIVFVSDGAKPGIDVTALIDAPPYVLFADSHALASRRSLRLQQIADEPVVLLDLPFTAQYLRGLFDAAGVGPRIVAHATSTEMVRSLVGAGVGCSVLNMRPRSATSYAGDALTAVPLRDTPAALRLALGTLSGQPRRLVSAFVAACQAHFALADARDMIAPAVRARGNTASR
ncbi:MAG: LysR family transcriptional regulator [Pseudomonadota bacterium]